MRKAEIDDLARFHPRLARKALELEDRAKARGLRSVIGLGRRWSWRDHLESSLCHEEARDEPRRPSAKNLTQTYTPKDTRTAYR